MSMHRPRPIHATKTNFSIDSNWKDIQHCIIISYMQRHCNMIIARTNSWITSTTLSTIVFWNRLWIWKEIPTVLYFWRPSKISSYILRINYMRLNKNLMIFLWRYLEQYIDSFIILFFKDNQIQNFYRVRSTQTRW